MFTPDGGAKLRKQAKIGLPKTGLRSDHGS